MDPIRQKLCERAIAEWGVRAQVQQLVEEMAELTVALSHWDRERCTSYAVVEEMADVLLMVDQLKEIVAQDQGVAVANVEALIEHHIKSKASRIEAKLT